jgi:hypothetical protein
MGFMDKIKQSAAKVEKAVGDHPDQLKNALNKVEGLANSKTGGKHRGQISKLADKAEDVIEKEAKEAGHAGPNPSTPPSP